MMDPYILRFLVRKVIGPVVVVSIILIMLAGLFIWEKIKTKWQERKSK